MILQVQGCYQAVRRTAGADQGYFRPARGADLRPDWSQWRGKTTLFNVINGVYTPEEGQVVFREKERDR